MSTDYVLVHSAGEGNWVWDGVRQALNRHRSGYAVVHGSHPRSSGPVDRVVAEDLPGHGYRRHEDLARITLEEFVDAVVGWIEGERLTNVVLVGHSMGGLILPQVAVRLPDRIKRLVFLGGLIPEPGKSALASLPLGRRALYLLRAWLKRAHRRGVPPLHKALAQPFLCNGMNSPLAGAAISRLSPYPLQPLTIPVMCDGLGGVPSTYVVLTRDRVLPPSLQRRMAKNLQNPDVVEMAVGHVSGLFLRASEIADLLLQYA